MNKNYVPLYRKYRPQTIEQIVGQEHIKKSLTNAIEMNRISHAYLFTGPRGTGKTSTARIFAKSLNCEKGITVSPCGECENCRNITNSVPIDVIEIDAASNRSVSDAEEIIQSVAMAPVHSRYKIYIIDEVHMLSTTAFNSLLKTLEEPPENVIFILATTEVHKVLDTIKSRCQRFDFKRITTEDISKHLRFISDKENINITDDAIYYIAQNSAGGMRDSIALLDQLSVISSENNAISVDDINRLLGRISFNDLTELFSNISNSNQNKSLEILNNIYNQGNDPIQILSNFLEYLRNSLIIKSVNSDDFSTIIQLNNDQIAVLKEKTSVLEEHQIISLINKCADYIKELKLTSNPKLWLDVAILDMSNLTQNTKIDELQSRISALENGISPKPNYQKIKPNIEISTEPVSRKTSTNPVQNEKAVDKTVIAEAKIETEAADIEVKSETKKNSNASLDNTWNDFLGHVSSVPTKIIMNRQVIPVKLEADEIILSVRAEDWLKKFSQGGEKYRYIEEAAKSMFGNDVKITVKAPNSSELSEKKNEKPEPVNNSQILQTNSSAEIEFNNNEEKDEDELLLDEEMQSTSDEAELQQLPNDNSQATKESSNDNSSFHSDNVNIIMDLFEGKIIE